MNCYNLSGSPIGIPGDTTANSISIYVIADGPPVLQPFVCVFTVTTGSSPVTQGHFASNITKVLVYDWALPTLNVCK